MNNLPAEILAVIFKLSLAWDEFRPNFISPIADSNYLGTPFPFTYVCSTWRDLAVNDPQLWSSIIVMRRPKSEDQTSSPPVWPSPQHIRLWFQRSAHMPLTISFSMNIMGADGVLSPSVEQCFRLFLSTMPRWKRVALQFPASDQPWPIPISAQHLSPAPSLQYIELNNSLGKMPLSDVYPWALHILRLSPNLQVIKYHRVYNTATSRSTDDILLLIQLQTSPFAQLRHLRLYTILPLPEIIGILRSCKHLISCSLRSVYRLPYDELEPFTLPAMKYLDIQCQAGSRIPFFPRIFDRIRTPALVGLSLKGEPKWDQSAFIKFLDRSMCRLKYLFLQGIAMSPNEVLACLKANPSLVEFGGAAPASCDGNVRLLTALQETDPVTGRLTTAPYVQHLVLDTGHLVVTSYRTENFALALKTRLEKPKNRLNRLSFTNNGGHYYVETFIYAISTMVMKSHPDVILEDRPPPDFSRWMDYAGVCDDATLIS